MILELTPESPEWLAYARTRPDALPFHHPAWALLLAECYGFRPFVLAAAGDGGGLVAGLPALEVVTPLRRKRWVALPFTDVCPPLGDEAGVAALAAGLDEARREAGAATLEVRAPLPGAGAAARVALLHTLALEPDAGAVARRFRASVARNVRTADAAGLTVRRAEDESDLAEVFYGLQVQTRRRLGLPVQPRRFFRLLWRRVLEPGLGLALFACRGAQPVAGAVFLTWNGTVTYKYGASDAASWGLRPNDRLFASAIEWACREGYRTLDLGRTDLGSDGLRRFKLGWGADEHDLMYSVLGADNVTVSHESGARLRPLLRRSPRWVVRAVGELLYRHAA